MPVEVSLFRRRARPLWDPIYAGLVSYRASSDQKSLVVPLVPHGGRPAAAGAAHAGRVFIIITMVESLALAVVGCRLDLSGRAVLA